MARYLGTVAVGLFTLRRASIVRLSELKSYKYGLCLVLGSSQPSFLL